MRCHLRRSTKQFILHRMFKKWHKGALATAGALALAFLNHPDRVAVCFLAGAMTISLVCGFSGWLTKKGILTYQRIGRAVLLVALCFIPSGLCAWHFWPTHVRTYLVFDGPLQFPRKFDPNGGIATDQNFRVGDRLEFNYFTVVRGPNPIWTHGTATGFVLEPDSRIETQREIVRLFWQSGQSTKRPEIIAQELMPGDRRFDTVPKSISGQPPRAIALDQATLDDIHQGRKVVFAIVELGYTDAGELHHARVCEYLLPPAYAPGVWHYCDVPFDSD